MTNLIWLGLAASYLLGCFSFGYYVTHWLTSKDIRSLPRLSSGGVPVAQLLGRRWFALFFMVDLFKGVLVAWYCQKIHFTELQALLCGMALIAGHLWPVQLKFRGGKGIAVMVGFFLIWNGWMVAIWGLSFFVLWVILQNYQLAGLVGMLSILMVGIGAHLPLVQVGGLVLIIVAVALAHREDLSLLFRNYRSVF